MNINDMSKPLSSSKLNESLAKAFGERIDLEKFTLEQLYDVRNKLRTKLSSIETNESFSSVYETKYQKTKMFLDVLNAAIDERGNLSEGIKDYDDEGYALGGGTDEYPDAFRKRSSSKRYPQFRQPAYEPKKPDVFYFYNVPTNKESVAKTIPGLKQTKSGKWYSAYPIPQAVDEFGSPKKWSPKVKESALKEGAEDTAEIIMAAKSMVNKLTSWMEDTAEMQTESMLELADAIRDEMGSQKSEEFINSVKPSLEQMYQTMEQVRQSLTNGVGILTGEFQGDETMGADDGTEVDMEPTVDQEAETDVDLDAEEDDFEGAAAAAGGEEAAGREQRESLDLSRRLGILLTSKKK